MGRNSRHSTEQIVNKLRQADVELAKGQSIAAVCKQFGAHQVVEGEPRLCG